MLYVAGVYSSPFECRLYRFFENSIRTYIVGIHCEVLVKWLQVRNQLHMTKHLI